MCRISKFLLQSVRMIISKNIDNSCKMKKIFKNCFKYSNMSISSTELFGESTEQSTHQDFNLFPHQANAAIWAKLIQWRVSDPRFMKGGVVSDDMGMGKTNVMCAVVATTPVPSTLILTPLSTKYQWIETLLKYVKNITVYTIKKDTYYICSLKYQDGDCRVETKPISNKKGVTIVAPMILVCNYQLITNGEVNKKLVTNHVWCTIIIDEGHFLRNNTKSWGELDAIKQPMITSCGQTHRYGTRWIVTGTPIQMNNDDIFNIFNFIDSRFLQGLRGQDANNMVNYLLLNNLFRRTVKQLTPYMRTILKIPENDPIFEEINVSFEETDISRYLENLSYENICAYCQQNPEIINSILKDERSFLICKAAEMRYNSNKSKTGSFTITEKFRVEMSFPYGNVCNFMNQILPDKQLAYRGRISKLDKVYQMLKSSNDNYIIFHHYDFIADKIFQLIREYFPEINLYRINGSVDDEERYDIIKNSARDIRNHQRTIIIASIKTSAEGMNFQAFSKIIKIDREYNLTVESQAESRVHRIGQLNQVYIYDFMMESFKYGYGEVRVDDHIESIRESKKHLAERINIYNASYTFRRYYITLEDGTKECGINFGEEFESRPHGSYGGPDSVGPE